MLPCTFTATVQGTAAGTYVNDNTRFSGQGGGINTAATTATLTVRNVAVTKAYAAASIPVGSTSTLTFTLTNGAGNPAQTNIAFTDTLTVGAGLTVTGVTALLGAGCSATTPTFNATSNPSVTLTAATMAAATATCTFTVTVQGNTAAAYLNSNGNGNFTAVSTSTDVTGASSTLTVYNRATLSKTYGTPTIGVGGSSTLTVYNPVGERKGQRAGAAHRDAGRRIGFGDGNVAYRQRRRGRRCVNAATLSTEAGVVVDVGARRGTLDGSGEGTGPVAGRDRTTGECHRGGRKARGATTARAGNGADRRHRRARREGVGKGQAALRRIARTVGNGECQGARCTNADGGGAVGLA